MDRRSFLWTAGLVAAAARLPAAPRKIPVWPGEDFARAVRDCERRSGGRLGVAVRDTGTGAAFAWKGDERFPMCSTFKLPLAAATLRRVELGQERLERRVPVSRQDLVDYAPFTEKRVGRDASVAELCEAAVTLSDNAAANLLLAPLGGPAGFTRYLRALGDPASRLDRPETALGECTPGDPRDTTTPNAMLGVVQRILLGKALSPASRARLTGWVVANTTGDHKLRAGLPAGWRVGDKTGGGDHGTSNDVAIVWPAARQPILIAVYLTESALNAAGRDAVIADVGRALAASLKA